MKSIINRKAIIEIGEMTGKRVLEPSTASGATEVAFWLLLSMVPASILLAQLLRLFTLSMEAANNFLGVYMSGEVYDIIAPLFEYRQVTGMTIFFIFLALWAGSSAVFSLMRVINEAYGTEPKTDNSIARLISDRLRAMLMTLPLLAIILFALYILVYGELLVNTIYSYSNNSFWSGYSFSEIWYGVRWIIAFILFFLMVFSIYYILARSGVAYKKYFADTRLATIKNVLRVWLKNRKRDTWQDRPETTVEATIKKLDEVLAKIDENI